MDGGDGLGDDAAALDHAEPHRARGRGEEQQEHDGGHALYAVVEAEARGEHDRALDGADGEGGLEDLGDGALGAADGDHREVEREGLDVVAEFVVDDAFGELVVPDRVRAERGALVLGERDPEPAAEGRGEREGHDAEHVVDFRLPDVGLGLRGGRGGAVRVRVGDVAHAEVDEHDGRGPVEGREALVPEVDHVEEDGHEDAVEGHGAARGVRVRAARARTEAFLAAAVAQSGGGGEQLEDLAAEAHDQEQHENNDHVRVLELELHEARAPLFNKPNQFRVFSGVCGAQVGRETNSDITVLMTPRVESSHRLSREVNVVLF